MEENAISGDDNTHWFHSNGIITSIDNSQKKICVDISQKNNFFDGTQYYIKLQQIISRHYTFRGWSRNYFLFL